MVPSNIYDPLFKEQERNNGVWELGWGRGGVTKYLSYIEDGGGVEDLFLKGLGGGVVKFFAHHMKM